jgi:hypothetical protein
MKYIALFLLMVMTVGFVGALPTTGACTNVTNNGVTFTATSCSGSGWFKWGSNSSSYKWSTPNQTCSGAITDYWIGSPLLVNKTYFVAACDSTGCGSAVSFTTGAANVTNTTSYGTGFITLMRSGFNASTILSTLGRPYTTSVPGGAPVTWGLLFFFIIAGFWLRHRDITLPCYLAMISGGAIWIGSSALGVPPEFAMVGQGLMYAAIAGMAVSWFSK